MNQEAVKKRNLRMFPPGTIGRDMEYNLVNNFLLTYVLFTRQLTAGQIAAITGLMVGARIFDALNDPIMGNIIEHTRTRWGKFKPWLMIGVLTTSAVIIFIFNTKLTGWPFIAAFGCFYFSFSITYTMHDISYWGMIPALGSDADERNRLTSLTTLCAGIGGTLAGVAIPLFTAGQFALGGNASEAYGRISILICILAPLFLFITIFGVRERRDDIQEKPEPVSLRGIVRTIAGNDQLLWVSLTFLIQQIGNGLIVGGIGSTFIYFRYGYSGGLYSLFTIVGMSATAFLMIFYPSISGKLGRKPLMRILLILSLGGYAVMLFAGFVLSSGMGGFWVLTVGYMLSNFGQFGFYLIMMISILNTVEYNEWKHGKRQEAVIASLRPFLTKFSSAVIVAVTALTYVLSGVTVYTNQISTLENQAAAGTITDSQKMEAISQVISGTSSGQSLALLVCMTLLSAALMLISYLLYRKHYVLDEETYSRICRKLEEKKTADTKKAETETGESI
ncbi:MAG: glycoside-pentoside-hexuronide (GPH):cation symporter [Lachnospiraceae bacterium]|jgi:sugar (glycoside-pentoside-hexuronide) transporter|nr:glycoside-pentoside-hexuronide (GPH):cation symporter [Lachnospiraceae bacterium]